MLNSDLKDELLDFLEKDLEIRDVIILPDFFYDRLISLECKVDSFTSTIADIAERRGGSIDGIAQTDVRGGNAINTASALATLGVNVTPIVCTSRLGFQKIRSYLKKFCVDLSHIKIKEKESRTTALEFDAENGKVNVMIRDLGALANFGPSDLTGSDYELVENADYVCLFNWAGTRKFGTTLAETVFHRAKTKGKGKTYYDPADPTPNKGKIPELLERVLKTEYVDVLSLNENEVFCFAKLLTTTMSEKTREISFNERAMEAARVLAANFSARIELHSATFSATITKIKQVVVPTFKIKPLRVTGAGDAWNAGNIIGDATGLSDECRLTLANAVSAYYLSDPQGAHPTRSKLAEFIKKATK